MPGVLEQSAVEEDVVGLVGAGDGIEIADQQDGKLGFLEGFDALADQGGALFAGGGLEGVVEVGVPEVEFPVVAAIFEADPGDHAAVGVAPGAGSHDLRGVAEPEVIVLEGVERLRR